MAVSPFTEYGVLGGALVGVGLGTLPLGFEVALDAEWAPRWLAADVSRSRAVVSSS